METFPSFVLTVIFTSAIVGAFGSFFMLYRNQWVLHTRLNVLHGRIEGVKYEQLPSYDAMLWKIWIWNAKGFV